MRTEEEIRAERDANLVELKRILAELEVKIVLAFLQGDAYAPSKKHPSIRFGVSISKGAFGSDGLAALGQWHMAIIFYREPCRVLNEEE